MISVIIPTFNEEKYLPRLLFCLKEQTFQDFEVIVADANSKDKTREIAINFGARVVEGGLPGRGRNLGANDAKSDLIFFVDADVTFSKNFLEKSLLAFEKKNLDLANFRFGITWTNIIADINYIRWNLLQESCLRSGVIMGSGCALMMKKDIFQKVGGFNEKLSIAEDLLFLREAVKKGFRFGIINMNVYPSTRRYSKVGWLKINKMYVQGSKLMEENNNKAPELTRKLVDEAGGWGEW